MTHDHFKASIYCLSKPKPSTFTEALALRSWTTCSRFSRSCTRPVRLHTHHHRLVSSETQRRHEAERERKGATFIWPWQWRWKTRTHTSDTLVAVGCLHWSCWRKSGSWQIWVLRACLISTIKHTRGCLGCTAARLASGCLLHLSGLARERERQIPDEGSRYSTGDFTTKVPSCYHIRGRLGAC